MARPLREDSPYRMDVPTRRDTLSGDALLWYDRAAALQGRALNIRPHERTAFQHAVDELWAAVEKLERGEEVDIDRMDRAHDRIRLQWSDVLTGPPPSPDWPVTAPKIRGGD